MPDAGFRVSIDTSSARSNVDGLKQSIVGLTDATKPLTEQMAQLNIRYAQQDVINGMAGAVDRLRKSHEDLARLQGLTEKEIKAIGDRAVQMAAQLRESSNSATAFGSSLGGLATKITAVVGAYISLREIAEKTRVFIERGINFNSAYESSQLGIASVLSATQDLISADGERLQGVEKLNASISISRDLMRDIQVMGLETTATTKELVAGFQTLLGPAQEAGFSLKQTEQFVVGMVQAFGAVGIEMNQLSAEGRSLLDGSIDSMRDRLATVLGISGEMVKNWKEQGNLFDELNSKLESFKLAGSLTAQTWRGLSSNMEEAFDFFAGETTEGIFTGAKTAMSEIINMMIDTKNMGLGSEIKNITTSLQAVGNDTGGLLVSGARGLVEKSKELNDWIGANRSELSEIYSVTKDIGGAVLDVLGSVGSVLTDVIRIGVESGAFSLALSAAKVAAVAINETFGYVELAFKGISYVIIDQINTPLAETARLMSEIGKTKIGSKFIDENQVKSLEEYAKRQEDGVQRAYAALEKSASRYRNTPFPALAKAYGDNESSELASAHEDSTKQYSLASPFNTFKATSDLKELTKANRSAMTEDQQRMAAWEDWYKQRAKVESIYESASKVGNTKIAEQAREVWGLVDQGFAKAWENAGKPAHAIAKQASEVAKYVSSIKNSALVEQYDLFGDKHSASVASAVKEYEDEVASLNEKLAQYHGEDRERKREEGLWWADYRKGVALARADLEDFRNTLSTVGDLMSDLGRLSGSPEASYQGAMFKLKAQYKDASDQAKALGISQDLVDQAYTLKAREAWQESYKGLTTIDGSAFDVRRAMLSREVEDFRKAGADETALRIYAAQKAEDIARDELQTRQAYAGSFTDFLRGQVNIELGLYQGAHSRQLQEWQDYYNDLKQLGQGWMDTMKSGLVDLIDGAVTGKGEDAWKNMLANMRRQFIQFAVDLAMDWAKANVFKPALGGMLGISSNETGTKTAEGAARGLASQAVSAPSSESVLAWLGQGVPTYTPSLVEEITAPAKQAAGAVSKAAGGMSAYLPEIRAAADWYGLPPQLIQSMVYHESRGNPNAVSGKGAMGLMQLMPGTAKEMGVDATNPTENIWGGTKMLAMMKERYGGDLNKALAAYNAGPGAVDAGAVPSSTWKYNEKVFADAVAYRSQGAADLSSIASLPGHHLEKLNQTFASSLGDMAKDFEEITGEKLRISDGFRTRAQQEEAYRNKPNLAARPGYSMHEYGYAVDIDSAQAKQVIDLINQGKLDAHGLDYLHGQTKTEPWHWQLADTYSRQAEIRNGSFAAGSLPYGPAGEEGTRAVASAASSYGLLGVNFGQLGAQSILSKIDTRGGIYSALTGDSASYAWNTSNVTQAGGMGSSFWTAPIGGNVWDVSTYSSALSGLSPTDSATAAKLVAMGMSPDQAVTLVTGSSGGSSTAQAVNSQTAQQGTNFNASDLLKNAGSGSWVDSLNQWGFENLGIGSITGEQVGNSVPAFQGMNATGWTGSTAGLGTIAAGALTGATTGFGISSLVYPNGTGTIGGTLGGLAGGALGSALLGSTIGGPIGGIVGGLLGSVLGGSETKKTEKTGSGVTVNITNGNVSQQGYSTYRTTTSGMFGSTSTSHSKSYDTVGDPELESAFRSALDSYTAQNWRSSVNMGISTSALKSFSFPFDFDIDSENASFAAKAVANYQAYQLLDNAGLRGEFDEVAKSGEVYVDALKRISDAYNTGSIAASAAGTSLEKLAGTMSTVFQGDWFSQVADLLGGTSQASGAFSTYVKYGLSKTQAVDYALSAYAGGAGSAIAQLGDASVNMGNFWGKYQEAMNAGNMSADQFALWANAASYMSSYSDTQYQALDLMQTINNVRIAQLKEEITEIQNVKVMVDGLNTSISSAYSTYKNLYDTLTSSIQSITWSSSLSTNTPTQTFKQQQAYYNKLKAKVANEDSSSLTYSSDVSKLSSFSQTYLQTAKSYYGASSQYYKIYNEVTGTLTKLQTTTKTELDYLAEQLAAQYTVVNQNQAQIDQLTIANTNLQILGAGIDALGTSITGGMSAIVAALGSSWSSSWDASLASAMQAYSDAYVATTASLGSTATVDTSSLASYDWSSLSALTGYATGGDPAAGEWAYVGEQGPELVRFGKDARVYNANETKAILAAKEGGNKATVAALQQNMQVLGAGFSALMTKFDALISENRQMRIVAERQRAK